MFLFKATFEIQKPHHVMAINTFCSKISVNNIILILLLLIKDPFKRLALNDGMGSNSRSSSLYQRMHLSERNIHGVCMSMTCTKPRPASTGRLNELTVGRRGAIDHAYRRTKKVREGEGAFWRACIWHPHGAVSRPVRATCGSLERGRSSARAWIELVDTGTCGSPPLPSAGQAGGQQAGRQAGRTPCTP